MREIRMMITLSMLFLLAIVVANPPTFTPFACHSPPPMLISRTGIDVQIRERVPPRPPPPPLTTEKIEFCKKWARKVCAEKAKNIKIKKELLKVVHQRCVRNTIEECIRIEYLPIKASKKKFLTLSPPYLFPKSYTSSITTMI